VKGGLCRGGFGGAIKEEVLDDVMENEGYKGKDGLEKRGGDVGGAMKKNCLMTLCMSSLIPVSSVS